MAHLPVMPTTSVAIICRQCRQQWPCLTKRGLVAVPIDLLTAVIHASTAIIKDTDPGLGGAATSRNPKGFAHGRAPVKIAHIDDLIVATERLGTAAFGARAAAAL